MLRREEHRDGEGLFINRKTYAYDQYSRPMLELRNYDSKWYYTTLRYDAYGRVEYVDRFWRPMDREGSAYQLSTSWNSFQTINTYNQYGFMLSVSDGTTTWWQCTEFDYDEQGRITGYAYGNGLASRVDYNPLTGRIDNSYIDGLLGTEVSDYGFVYDRLGNLEERSHSRSDPQVTTLIESCTYDELNRLKTTTVDGASSSVVTYDALGNIQTRTGITGTYFYESSRPHAVTTAGDCTYYYDDNGNIIRRDRDGEYECSISWNSFNKPVSIFSGLVGSEFEYDVNGKRTQQIIFEDDGSVRKKIYVAETYEHEETLSNPTETDRSLWVWSLNHTRIYVDTPVGKVGIYEQEGVSGTTGNVTQSWTHKDPLGSVIAVSDASGTLTWCSFDAWGNRRNADDWTASTDPASLAPSATDRGYTGHEQLDHLELVHMNGRIYDPVIAKMISPDPTIPFPDNLQAYNRYAYVMNRPLSLTDPSGFTPENRNALYRRESPFKGMQLAGTGSMGRSISRSDSGGGGFNEKGLIGVNAAISEAISSSGLSTRDQIGDGKRTTEYRSESQSFLGSDGMQSYQQNCAVMLSGSKKDDISKKEADATAEDGSSGEEEEQPDNWCVVESAYEFMKAKGVEVDGSPITYQQVLDKFNEVINDPEHDIGESGASLDHLEQVLTAFKVEYVLDDGVGFSYIKYKVFKDRTNVIVGSEVIGSEMGHVMVFRGYRDESMETYNVYEPAKDKETFYMEYQMKEIILGDREGHYNPTTFVIY
jgi:RHS repeat-associated protein